MNRRASSAVWMVALATQGALAPAGADSHATRVVIGAGAGMMAVDLPHPETSQNFGNQFRLRFDVGVRLGARLEVAGELGIARLGAADSVNAHLRQTGEIADAAYSFVDWTGGVRVLLVRGRRWSPWLRAGLGAGWLKLSAPQGYRDADLTWTGGAGLDVEPLRQMLLRIEGRWLGQSSSETRHHFTVDAGVYYAMRRSQFD